MNSSSYEYGASHRLFDKVRNLVCQALGSSSNVDRAFQKGTILTRKVGKMPWEKQYNENEVLERAMHAFWSHGYAATTMRELVASTGINRGSIYADFTDKRSLFLKALQHYDKHYRANYLDRLRRKRDARAAVLAAFESAAKPPRGNNRPAGCFLVNTALELSPHDAEVRGLVKKSLAEVEDFFFAQIEAAKRQGTVRKGGRSRETAQALLGLFLGLRVLTRSDPEGSLPDSIISQARTMLE